MHNINGVRLGGSSRPFQAFDLINEQWPTDCTISPMVRTAAPNHMHR